MEPLDPQSNTLKSVYSLSGPDGQALLVALDEIQVLAGPVEHLEAGVELEQQALARAVEVVGHVQRARGQRTKHVIVRVLDHDQDRALQLVHFAVQRVQREPVQRRAEHQRPGVALRTRRQVSA